MAFIATDFFRASFFAGIACLLIGWLRNRRWKREAERKADSPPLHPPRGVIALVRPLRRKAKRLEGDPRLAR